MEKKAARWWEKLGKPQYGGELVFRLNRKIVNFDPYFGHHLTQIHTGWMERLHAADWTLDRGSSPPIKKACFLPGEKDTWPKAGNLPTPILMLSICIKESTGRISRRPTAVSLPQMMWHFISTGCTGSAAATPNPARPGLQ